MATLDRPWLVVLQHKPESLTPGGGVKLAFTA
jgi:hypothetical protein